MCEETVHHRGCLEESRNVVYDVLHVLECFFHFNICVV